MSASAERRRGTGSAQFFRVDRHGEDLTLQHVESSELMKAMATFEMLRHALVEVSEVLKNSEFSSSLKLQDGSQIT